MTEISYQVFDEVSGLPIRTLSDGFIREMAQRQNKSCSEIFNEVKEEVSKAKIEYFVKRDSSEIMVVVGEGRLKCQGEYYDDYSDAFNSLSDLNEN